MRLFGSMGSGCDIRLREGCSPWAMTVPRVSFPSHKVYKQDPATS